MASRPDAQDAQRTQCQVAALQIQRSREGAPDLCQADPSLDGDSTQDSAPPYPLAQKTHWILGLAVQGASQCHCADG